MEYSPLNLPFGYTIFCDDLRQEVGNKVSLMGIYNGVMVLGSAEAPVTFPTMLPKIALSINLTEKPSDVPKELEIRVYLPGDTDEEPTQKIVIPIGEELKSRGLGKSESDDAVVQFGANMVISPFHIKEPGSIKVRAFRDGKALRMGALKVVAFGQENDS